jgi:amino acid transporter
MAMEAALQTKPGEDESPAERVNRELDELLQQLRIALPGVQVLFAFLLTVPFTNRFDAVDGSARVAFFVAFLATTAAAALLLAPVSYARIQFRHTDKERLLQLGTRTAIAGLALLAVAITAATFVVTQVLYADTVAAVIAALVAALIGVLWFVLPLLARLQPGPTAPPAGSP